MLKRQEKNFGCLCSLKLGIEQPDFLDFNSGLMEVSKDLVTSRLDTKAGDTKLVEQIS